MIPTRFATAFTLSSWVTARYQLKFLVMSHRTNQLGDTHSFPSVSLDSHWEDACVR